MTYLWIHLTNYTHIYLCTLQQRNVRKSARVNKNRLRAIQNALKKSNEVQTHVIYYRKNNRKVETFSRNYQQKRKDLKKIQEKNKIH